MRKKGFAFVVVTIWLGIYAFSAAAGADKKKPLIYFGVGPRYHPITLYERFQPMMDYLTQQTPYRFELKISIGYKEVITALAEGETAVCAVGDGGLMKAIFLYGAVPIVRPLNAEGKPFYRCYFIVRANSELHSLSELKGKKVAFGSRHSTTGNLIPRYMLRNSGVRIEELGSLDNLRNHDAVARAIAKGEYDAGAVKSTVADIYKNNGLRILAESEDLPSNALIVRKEAPKELVQAITDALVKLDRRNPDHRKILESLDLEYRYGFAPTTIADYSELIRQFKTIPYGCGTGCHQ